MDILGIGVAVAVPLVVLGVKGYLNLNSRLTVTEVMLRLLLRGNGHSEESLDDAIRNELNNHKSRGKK
jgi:hypothetical protein